MITASIQTDKCQIDYCDASGMNCHSRCPAKYYFERVLGLRQPDAKMINPDFGTAIHAAMPFAYDDPPAALRAFEDVWHKLGYDDSDDLMNSNRALLMIEDFNSVRRQPHGPYIPLDPPAGRLKIDDKYSDYEASFLVDIGGDFPLGGRIDRIVKLKVDKKRWPLDYKTSREVSARIVNNFDCCIQVLSYTIGSSILLDERVPGMIVELLRKSKSRTETTFSPMFVSEIMFEKGLEWIRKEMAKIKFNADTGSWPMNLAGCSSYGPYGVPGYVCDYKPLCQLPDWKDGKKFYDIKLWHPFVVNKEEDK